MPASLSDWTDRLQGQPLPVMPLTIQRITRLIDRPSTTNADYQRVIGRDPGFTLSIFRRFVDSGLSPREPVTTPAHGITLLGRAPVVEGIRLPRLKKPAPGGASQGIYGCYAQGAHAAGYACNWGRTLGEANPDEMGIAALLQHCGEMALWANARDEMQKIEHHVKRGLNPDNAALAVLGFTIRQLSQALAGRWELPPLAQDALQPFGAFRPRAIGVMLAAELARASSRAWNSDETRALLELVAERQHLTLDQATACVHRLSVDLARELQGLPLPVAAFDLILAVPQTTEPVDATATAPLAGTGEPVTENSAENPARGANAIPSVAQPDAIANRPPIEHTELEDNLPDPPNPADNTAAAPRSLLPKSPPVTIAPLSAQSSEGNQDTASEAVPDNGPASDKTLSVTTMPPPEERAPVPPVDEAPPLQAETKPSQVRDKNLQQSISLMMRELLESIGMDRAMFAMLTPDRKALRARFVIGAGKEASLRRFQLSLEQRHLFSLLLTKPQEFWLNSSNQEKYLPLIPASLHATLDTRGFFATSLFMRSRPLGILYSDCNDASTLNHQGFAHFKQLTQRLSNELVNSRLACRYSGEGVL